MSVTVPAYRIPRRTIAGMEGMWAKMWDPPTESPNTPELLNATIRCRPGLPTRPREWSELR